MPVDIEVTRERWGLHRYPNPRPEEQASDVAALIEEISNLRAALGEERAAHARAGVEVQELKDLALALTEARDEARAELADRLAEESPCDHPTASWVDGHCRCIVCARCKRHTGNANYGHFSTWCSVTGTSRAPHLCCPDNCELGEVGDVPS